MCESVGCTDLPKDRFELPAFVNKLMNLWIP
jgi:hypothetical protein